MGQGDRFTVPFYLKGQGTVPFWNIDTYIEISVYFAGKFKYMSKFKSWNNIICFSIQ